MENEDKKISQLPQTQEPDGTELLLYGGSSNGSVSTAAMKAYAQTGMQKAINTSDDLSLSPDGRLSLTDAFKNSKLDTSVWTDANKQFGIAGEYFHIKKYPQTSSNYKRTDFIPINHSYDIIVRGKGTSVVSAIAFFDANRNAISTFLYDTFTEESTKVCAAADIPENAVYFIASTQNGVTSAWANGPATAEARESAAAYAIFASNRALFCDLFNAAAGNNGYARIAADGSFECALNNVPLSYAEALVVYRYGTYADASTILECQRWGQSADIPQLKTTLPTFAKAGDRELHNIAWPPRNLVTVKFNDSTPDRNDYMVFNGAYLSCCSSTLKEILDPIVLGPTCHTVGIVNVAPDPYAKNLETIYIYHLDHSITINLSAISLESMEYLVAYALNRTTAITISVHPTVYAKLIDESLLEWNQVLLDAAAKNITFASTY